MGDSVLLLLPTERNKLTLAWRGPYKVVGIVGDFDYRVEVSPDKVKTYHILLVPAVLALLVSKVYRFENARPYDVLPTNVVT